MTLDPARACLIRRTDSVGSGYRLTNTLVMTAAHVIAGHGEITVTSGPGEETEHRSLATPVWSHLEEGRVDLAVLELANPAGDVPTVGFGRLSDRAAVVEAQAMGYPRWKFRDDDHKYREAAHVTGKIPVLANRRSGTLEFIVPPRTVIPIRSGRPGAGCRERRSGAAPESSASPLNTTGVKASAASPSCASTSSGAPFRRTP